MTHPVDAYVGKRLKQCRVAAGLSQDSLANAVGITFQQVQKYERGSNRMGASRLYEFARVLSVPIGYFFEGFEKSQSGNAGHAVSGMAEESIAFEHEPINAGRESLEFIRAYQRLRDPKTRKAVNDLIRSLADGNAVVEE